ncbi:DUF1990 family protein [Streptomyces sp. NPDC001922]|uniref:DUF1990 family protein n=1 Tax=Streptomyces sp. NPDC001922 TaxID=3364624 RepID=UPI00367516EE
MPADLRRQHTSACEQQLTYPEHGATLDGPFPSGYSRLHHRVRLGEGRELFERAGAHVLDWAAQRGSGFSVYPGDPAAPGETVLITIRVPGLRFPRRVIPCRVVWTLHEERRAGFAYGTLSGHPECGEESFTVTLDADDGVWFEVAAFSRPGTWYTRWGGPLTRLVQHAAARRYLRAVVAAVSSR